jgi:hypothetical protein
LVILTGDGKEDQAEFDDLLARLRDDYKPDPKRKIECRVQPKFQNHLSKILTAEMADVRQN